MRFNLLGFINYYRTGRGLYDVGVLIGRVRLTKVGFYKREIVSMK